jgi:signal transduction histidine kinase
VFLKSKREAITGKPFTDLVTDPRVVDALKAVSAGSIRTRSIVELKRDEAQGGGVLRFSIRPVRRDDSATALVMIEDVTQQRVADEARNSFVAQATHELRTPLTNIRLYVEQAVEEGEQDPALRARALNVINQESRRLERIVGDMLSVSEIEAGSLKLQTGDVRLDALFRDLETDFAASAAEKKIDLKFELPPKFPVIQGDRDKMVLALHNLIGNAVKYTPEGGKVKVRVEAEDGSVHVAVTDTGIGISDEESELVFERFYRSRDGRVSKITGSGLGLALAREVVRMHGGDITLTSKLNQGSTFKATFPVRAMAA